MPANLAPIFPLVPVIGVASLVSPTALTARTSITGTTGLTNLLNAGANGTRVDKITVHHKDSTALSTAGAVWVWLYTGVTSHLLAEILVAAVTGSATVSSFDISTSFANLVLPSTHSLYVSSTIDQDFNVFAFGGDY